MFYVIDVANVKTDYKRLTLRVLYNNAITATPALTLEEALMANMTAQYNASKYGLGITQTAGNSHSTSFQILDGNNGASPGDLADLAAELYRRYEEAVAYLGGTPTDAQILTEMLRCLAPVKTYISDWSMARVEQWPLTPEEEADLA